MPKIKFKFTVKIKPMSLLPQETLKAKLETPKDCNPQTKMIYLMTLTKSLKQPVLLGSHL